MKRSWVVALALVCACAPSRNARPPVSPASLVDLAKVDWNFSWRQSIRATYARPDRSGQVESATFEAVLQKEGPTLTLVGFTPFGSRAFVIRQVGSTVSVLESQAAALPFDESYILLDVNRCFFLGLTSKVLPDGWHQQELKGEVIQDLWQAGRLTQRVFRPKAEPAGPSVVVHYVPGFARTTAPTQVELVNDRYRYRLKITLLDADVP